ncbi:hypothetical protein [Niallia endozanthoxylica]|uniref:Uncharacterized protein n=1 Tax=Niallia endozanthoxylica TaxID=2036016 RepID=A0A5J5H5C3_9BACI|nr:hypothetical protein [Niallia endozanthoxylica]KAA9015740.1 hypothetical protein F4V44_22675 [Niallia endozanthoxylica]
MSEIKYSQYDLINKEIKELDEGGFANRFVNFILTDRRLPFKVKVPNDLFQRAEILCEDVVEMKENNKAFTQAELIEYIFKEFLEEVRKNDGNLRSFQMKFNNRMKDLPMINGQPLLPQKRKTTLHTKIGRKEVRRAEVFLKDLSFLSNHDLTVEKLLEMVYIDFLNEYQQGRRKKVLKEIIEAIDQP